MPYNPAKLDSEWVILNCTIYRLPVGCASVHIHHLAPPNFFLFFCLIYISGKIVNGLLQRRSWEWWAAGNNWLAFQITPKVGFLSSLLNFGSQKQSKNCYICLNKTNVISLKTKKLSVTFKPLRRLGISHIWWNLQDSFSEESQHGCNVPTTDQLKAILQHEACVSLLQNDILCPINLPLSSTVCCSLASSSDCYHR